MRRYLERETDRKQHKLTEPDILRSMAFLAVVAQHILGCYARRAGTGPFAMKAIAVVFELTRFAVPMFVFLFAMMQFSRYYTRLNYLSYLKKRTLQLLIPYTLWTGLYLYYDKGLSGLAPVPFGKALLFGNGAYHLWYVVMIFQFVLCTPLFFALIEKLLSLRRSPKTKLALSVLLFALCLAYITFTPKLRSESAILTGFFFSQRSKIFLSWLVFYFAGAFCGLYYERFRNWVRRAALPCVVLFITVLIPVWQAGIDYVDQNAKVNFSLVSFLDPGFALVTFLGMVVLFRVAMALSHFRLAVRVTSWIGSVSYRAYLAHVMCLNIINRYTLHLFNSLPLYYIWLFSATVGASLLYGFAVRGISSKLVPLFRAVPKKPLNEAPNSHKRVFKRKPKVPSHNR